MDQIDRSHTHRFDPLSGWCQDCNYRDDGRLVSKTGHVWREGTGIIPTHNQKIGA